MGIAISGGEPFPDRDHNDPYYPKKQSMPAYTDQEILNHRNSFWLCIIIAMGTVAFCFTDWRIDQLSKPEPPPVVPSGVSTGAMIQIPGHARDLGSNLWESVH